MLLRGVDVAGLAQVPNRQIPSSPDVQSQMSDPALGTAATSDAGRQEAAAFESEAVTARAQGPAQATAIEDQQVCFATLHKHCLFERKADSRLQGSHLPSCTVQMVEDSTGPNWL